MGRGEGAQARAREGIRRAESQPPLSAIAARLARGEALDAAVRGAKDFVARAIAAATEIGSARFLSLGATDA